MNILDPMKPDRLYKLDLRRYDHREWCKIIAVLAVAEPGDNWEICTYRWAKYDDAVPGKDEDDVVAADDGNDAFVLIV